jgi:hypothetical protein
LVRLDEPSWEKVCAPWPDLEPGVERVGEVVVVVSANVGVASIARMVLRHQCNFMSASVETYSQPICPDGVADAGAIECEAVS